MHSCLRFLVVLAAGMAGTLHAQGFPAKPVRVIVSFPACGITAD